jgi:lipid II:glycine glycyltransferase (peptidoglycan interpeptide bridge formation enzyme)
MRVLDSLGAFPDPATWDALVAADLRGHLLQTWAWGDLKGAFGWTPVRLAVDRDGALVAGAQVLYRRLGPITTAYIPKGPVLPDDGHEVADLLWQGIARVSRRMRAISLKVEPEWRDEDAAAHRWLLERGLRPSAEPIQPRRTIIVDLRPSEDAILARMKPKWRYNIRLAMRHGVEVREGGVDDLPLFYRLMQTTGQRDRFAIHSIAYYRRAWECFAPQGRARLLIASHQGEPLGALMAYAFNGQSWYMFGASSDAHRETMPNHLLQWRAMQWARSCGCAQYDFWGITDVDASSPTAALEGVERFKGGFGGEVARYVGAYDQDYAPALAWTMRRAWALRRRRAADATAG